jgi:hypothetical protein
MKEYFFVVIADREAAVTALRDRRPDAELTIVGEATTDDLKWLDAQDGQIRCVSTVS